MTKLKIKKTKYQLLKSLFLFSALKKQQETTRSLKFQKVLFVATKFAKLNFAFIRARILSSHHNFVRSGVSIINRIQLKTGFKEFVQYLDQRAQKRKKLTSMVERTLITNFRTSLVVSIDHLRALNLNFNLQKKYFANYVV